MKIFIGHDSRYKQATLVCQASIKQFPSGHKINWLDKKTLKRVKVYGRKDLKNESTEFSFTRFYVPLLTHYKGIAMFCDNDFVFKSNPADLEKYLGDKTVAVVKHSDYQANNVKMDGKENKSYPRKNWSSLMVFNCEKLKDVLTKEYLDNASASDLHELKWVDDSEIASIPRSWNCLVGHNNCDNADALHYTNGGPWFDEYQDCEHSELWWRIYNNL